MRCARVLPFLEFRFCQHFQREVSRVFQLTGGRVRQPDRFFEFPSPRSAISALLASALHVGFA
jgi:hypothetical protein